MKETGEALALGEEDAKVSCWRKEDVKFGMDHGGVLVPLWDPMELRKSHDGKGGTVHAVRTWDYEGGNGH